MSNKQQKLYFSISASGQTIDLSNESDSGDANGDANGANDGDVDGDDDDDDDGYVTGDSADVSDEDDYLQNKGCDTIVSARQTTRPATRILVVRDTSEANMLNAMRSRKTSKRKLQHNKSSAKAKREYLNRDYGSKQEMLSRANENNPKHSAKNDSIAKDGTLLYTLWGGRWVLFCTVCLCAVHAKVCHTARHINGSSSKRGHQSKLKLMAQRRCFQLELFRHLTDWIKQNTLVKSINLPHELHSFRCNTVYSFMKAGLPMNAINELRDYIEENNAAKQRVTHSNNLGMYIPIIESAENQNIMAFIRTLINENASLESEKYKYHPCWIIFDGTTRVDEVLCTVARFVLRDFTIDL